MNRESTCFNCETTTDVRSYSFDLDLPTINACKVCVLGLSMGDEALLKAMRPRRPRRKTAR